MPCIFMYIFLGYFSTVKSVPKYSTGIVFHKVYKNTVTLMHKFSVLAQQLIQEAKLHLIGSYT